MYSQNEVQEDIQSKLNNINAAFYATNPKKTFFKDSQKIECAEYVTQKLDAETLIKNTVYVLPNTSKVFFNYSLFKRYANPGVYTSIIKYILQLIDSCIKRYNSFEMHVDLNTFSVSAAHRYKGAIEMFCSECLSSGSNAAIYEHLTRFYIYNIPSMIDHISVILNPFINEQIKSKIEYVSKRDSVSQLEQFYKGTLGSPI
jgi:hypothetical protein